MHEPYDMRYSPRSYKFLKFVIMDNAESKQLHFHVEGESLAPTRDEEVDEVIRRCSMIPLGIGVSFSELEIWDMFLI